MVRKKGRNMQMDRNNRVLIDVREVASKLAFLVGKTILFRNGVEDATTATQVLAVKAANISGVDGHPLVEIYTTVGVENIVDSDTFKTTMLLESDGSLKCLGDYTDQMGICF